MRGLFLPRQKNQHYLAEIGTIFGPGFNRKTWAPINLLVTFSIRTRKDMKLYLVRSSQQTLSHFLTNTVRLEPLFDITSTLT